MQDVLEVIDFEAILAHERPRLVRLCAWFSRHPEAAEDLAQETLVAAWKSRDQLASLEKLKPWTASIARNVCLNWSRRYYREQSHLLYAIDSQDEPLEEGLRDESSLELELDRSDLARLLDQALAFLPPATARMLVEHYIQESSHAELAEKMSINPGAVAVRLQRGKLTLRKILRRNFGPEASAFGLMDPHGRQWEETNIWCPWCGQAHLVGKYRREELFALRCPRCEPQSESIMVGLDLSKPYHAGLLGSVKTYKPAYTRLLGAFRPLYEEALKAHTAPCLACGRAVQVTRQPNVFPKPPGRSQQIQLHCSACGWASNKSLAGFVLGSLEAQRFWREHPRMMTLPTFQMDVQGSPVWVTRLKSMTGHAELTVISRYDTFEQIEVHSNVEL